MSLIFSKSGKGKTFAYILKGDQIIDKLKVSENPNDELKVSKNNNKLTIKNNTLILPSEYKLQPIIPKIKDENRRMVIVGATGSGKSTFASNVIKFYRKDFPKSNEVFLFTRNKEDKSIDHVNPVRVDLTEDDIIEAYQENEPVIDIEALSNSLVVMDDIEQASKILTKYLIELRNDLAQNGRKIGINLISIIHQTDFRNTRLLFTEMSSITLFMASSQASNKRILKEYVGLNHKQIEMLKKLPSRWIHICTNYPMTCVYEKGAFII